MAEFFFSDHAMYYEFYFNIRIHHPNKGTEKGFGWHGMTFNHFCRWAWYFNYRAALAKVQNPMARITVYQGKRIVSVIDIEKMKQGRIRATKAKITEMRNKLAKIDKMESGQLFNYEDHPDRKKFLATIEAKERWLQLLIDHPAEEIFDKNTGYIREDVVYVGRDDIINEQDLKQ